MASALLRRGADLAWHGLVLAVLLAVWSGLLLGGAGVLFRHLFAFDPLDLRAWLELRRQYLAGASVPFSFAAAAAGLPAIGVMGGVILLFRLPAIVGRLPEFRGLEAAGDGLAWLAERLPSWRNREVPGLATLLRGAIGGLRPRVRAIRPGRPSAGGDGAGPGQPAVEDFPPSIRLDGEPMLATRPAVSPGPPDGNAGTSGPTGDDALHFGRALALLDVWRDPAAGWMEEALAEELEALSAAGWALWAGVGPSTVGPFELAALRRLAPAGGAAGRAAAEALDRLQPAPPDVPGAEVALLQAAGEPPAATGIPTGMSLSAAWLCGLLDNYAMLDERRRTAGDFDARWGGVFAETVERLREAMRTMGESDWASLDRYPDRASQVRVMTDRLRETFSGREPAHPSVEADAPIAVAASCATRDPAPDPADALSDRLAACGFILSAVSDAAGGEHASLLARRGDLALVIGPLDLGGGTWSAPDGSLGRWRSDGGRTIGSPCRTLWQKMALLRSLAGQSRLSGLVVLGNGSMAEEDLLAGVLAGECRRSHVAIAWLDRDDRPLPSLQRFLADLRSPADKAGGALP